MEINIGGFIERVNWSEESLSDLSRMTGLDVKKNLVELLTQRLNEKKMKEARKIPTLTGRISKIKPR